MVCCATAERAPSAPMMLRARTVCRSPVLPSTKLMVLVPSLSLPTRSNLPLRRIAPCEAARSRSHSSNCSRSTIPTNPPSIGMSTLVLEGAIMRAERALATNSSSGISKSFIARGGIAPPQGLMRPARSSSNTRRPRRAKSSAAVAPAGPPPTTTTSNCSCALMMSPHRLLLR